MCIYCWLHGDSQGGRWLVIWCVQPDGRYWEDEYGFGGESDSEIELYSFLADNGRFTQPFKLYRIGVTDYYKPVNDKNNRQRFA